MILGLDINLLFDQSLTPYFCAVNAASRVVKDVVRRCGWEYLSSIEAFNWMFDDGINKLLSDASSKYKKKDEALANETVDIQAEVLIKGVIAPSYICDIVVGNSKHENAVKCFLLSRQIKKYPNVIIANGYFFG